jgi:3-hydroxyisobutyrate dehydrogenase-like beta-hydroxyacid dehydrogenase
MNIAILGTGIVARTVTPRLLAAGHSVVLGSRDPGDEKLAEWLAQQPGDAQAALFGATGTMRLNFAVIREPGTVSAAAK